MLADRGNSRSGGSGNGGTTQAPVLLGELSKFVHASSQRFNITATESYDAVAASLIIAVVGGVDELVEFVQDAIALASSDSERVDPSLWQSATHDCCVMHQNITAKPCASTIIVTASLPHHTHANYFTSFVFVFVLPPPPPFFEDEEEEWF